MTNIKAIIFDLGKVVFDLSFDRAFHSWAKSSGLSFEELKSKFRFDAYFEKFERNEITSDEFRSGISNMLNFNISEEDFDLGWCEIYLEKYEGIDDLLINLKSKYQIVAFTNNNVIHNATWRNKYFETLNHFKKIFSSYEMATRKPEEKSFQIVLDFLQYLPSEVVFLDDNIDNINGAKILGIQTILVTSLEQMKLELKNYGVLI
jgi:putative hydrolase of the HAD superfamily